MMAVIRAVRAIRNLRAQLRIPSDQNLEAIVEPNGLSETVEEESPAIRALARVEPLNILGKIGAHPPDGDVMTLVVDPLVVKLSMRGVVDIPAERSRLVKELADCESGLERVTELLAKPDFKSRAPEEVVEREQERLQTLKERKERLGEVLAQLQS